jgi:hypothetical protein
MFAYPAIAALSAVCSTEELYDVLASRCGQASRDFSHFVKVSTTCCEFEFVCHWQAGRHSDDVQIYVPYMKNANNASRSATIVMSCANASLASLRQTHRRLRGRFKKSMGKLPSSLGMGTTTYENCTRLRDSCWPNGILLIYGFWNRINSIHYASVVYSRSTSQRKPCLPSLPQTLHCLAMS